MGSTSGIHFQFQGDLAATATLGIQVTFGLTASGQFFIQEGSSIKTTVNVDGELTGAAVIPNLVGVHARAGSPSGGHLATGAIDVLFSDFDSIAEIFHESPTLWFFMTMAAVT